MPEVLTLQSLQEDDDDELLECCCSTFSVGACCIS